MRLLVLLLVRALPAIWRWLRCTVRGHRPQPAVFTKYERTRPGWEPWLICQDCQATYSVSLEEYENVAESWRTGS